MRAATCSWGIILFKHQYVVRSKRLSPVSSFTFPLFVNPPDTSVMERCNQEVPVTADDQVLCAGHCGKSFPSGYIFKQTRALTQTPTRSSQHNAVLCVRDVIILKPVTITYRTVKFLYCLILIPDFFLSGLML